MGQRRRRDVIPERGMSGEEESTMSEEKETERVQHYKGTKVQASKT